MPGRFARNSSLTLAVVGSVAGVVACVEPEPSAWEGDLLTVTSSDGVDICGGTLAFLDRFVDHTYRYWTGESPPDDFALTLELRVGDPSEQGGLAKTGSGYAWTTTNRGLTHELTHLTVGWNDGSSAPSLAEGVAESFGPGDAVALWGALYEHPIDFAFLPRDEFFYSSGEFSARYYGPSAQLFRLLVDRYGVVTVRSAYQAARPDQTSEEIESAFVSVFGDDLYEAFDEFVDAPQCGLQAWECNSDIVPLRMLPIVIAEDTDCTDDVEVVGANAPSDLWFPVHQFAVDLPAETELVVDTTDNAFVQRVMCVDECDEPPWNPITGHTLSLESAVWGPGRSHVTVRPADPSRPFSGSIRVAD